MNENIPEVEGLRFKNKGKDEIRIYVTVQGDEINAIKYVISDITIRKYRTRTHMSLNKMLTDSYLYKCCETELERKEYLAEEYLKYVTEAQMEEALLNAWRVSCPFFKCQPSRLRSNMQ